MEAKLVKNASSSGHSELETRNWTITRNLRFDDDDADDDGDGDGDGNGSENIKNSIGLISKTPTLHVQGTFYIHFFTVAARI